MCGKGTDWIHIMFKPDFDQETLFPDSEHNSLLFSTYIENAPVYLAVLKENPFFFKYEGHRITSQYIVRHMKVVKDSKNRLPSVNNYFFNLIEEEYLKNFNVRIGDHHLFLDYNSKKKSLEMTRNIVGKIQNTIQTFSENANKTEAYEPKIRLKRAKLLSVGDSTQYHPKVIQDPSVDDKHYRDSKSKFLHGNPSACDTLLLQENKLLSGCKKILITKLCHVLELYKENLEDVCLNNVTVEWKAPKQDSLLASETVLRQFKKSEKDFNLLEEVKNTSLNIINILKNDNKILHVESVEDVFTSA